jgi:hypothetical protein
MCTISTVFCARLIIGPFKEYKINHTSRRFKGVIMVQLGNAIEHAIEKVNKSSGALKLEEAIEMTTKLLSKLVRTINGDLQSQPELSAGDQGTPLQHWIDLRKEFDADFKDLDESFRQTSLEGVMYSL